MNMQVIPNAIKADAAVSQEAQTVIRELQGRGGLEHGSRLLRMIAMTFEALLRAGACSAGGEKTDKPRLELAEVDLLQLSVEELGRKMGLSPRQLNRLSHKEFGLSIAEVKMELRLVKAASMLSQRDGKVLSISKTCGFSNPGFFNTCFKRRFGVSPGLWRKLSAPFETEPDDTPCDGATCKMRNRGLCPWSSPPADNRPSA